MASFQIKRFAFSKPSSEPLKPSLPNSENSDPNHPDSKPLTPDEQRAELEKCAADPVYFVDHYCYTFDPREEDPVIAFKLWERQKEYLRWLQWMEANKKRGVVDKCRDAGVTWLSSGYMLWAWLFRAGFTAGVGSRKLELVDKLGDPKCIFEKIRFMLDRLPAWMMPPGFNKNQHDNHARLVNPANGSTITGEGGDEIGRGGRTTMYFVDEHAFLEHAERVDASLSQNTRVEIDISTHNGIGTLFYRKLHSGKYQVFVFDWRDDPRKDDAWYKEQFELFDPVQMAQEIDRDPAASVEGVVIPAKWVQAAINLDQKLKEKGIELPETGPLTAAMDIAEEGKNRTVLGFKRGVVVKDIVDWGQLTTHQTAYKACDEIGTRGAVSLNYDVGGPGVGVKGTFLAMDNRPAFSIRAINGGDTCSARVWEKYGHKSSRDLFKNLRAEMAWILRDRFEKTFEYVELGIEHPLEELISIPKNEQLIRELSMPLYERIESGKIKLETKEDMRRRGVASPDHFDMLCYLFAPEKRSFGAS